MEMTIIAILLAVLVVMVVKVIRARAEYRKLMRESLHSNNELMGTIAKLQMERANGKK